MKKRLLAFALTLAMVLSLTVPAMAAGQTFSDVPESYWGYADIEAVSKAGYMKGVGGGRFSPENKVTVAQFLTLLGRLVFPDVKTEGNDWYGPYVTAAQEAKLLDGTQVDTDNLEAEITRYDMAVILRAAAKKLGVTEKSAQSSEVTDYLDIPTRYAEAVLAVYGMGLIKGVGGGSFNGTGTMRRAEVATVIMRLARATGSHGGTVTEPTDPSKPTSPDEDPIVTYEFRGRLRQTEHAMAAPAFDKHTYLPGVSVKLYYTPDGGKTSTLVAEGTTDEGHPVTNSKGEFIRMDDVGWFLLSFEAPESWGRGKNFYVSAETVYEGQKLVTSDLRTDGRDYKELWEMKPGPSEDSYGNLRTFVVETTPPTGEKAKLTYKGVVTYFSASDEQAAEGFTVRLHFKDGVVLGEAVTDANGHFAMDFEVDALDNPFDELAKQYYVTIEGVRDGVRYAITPEKNGKVALTSLYVLGVCVPMGSGKWINEDSIIRFTSLDAVSP